MMESFTLTDRHRQGVDRGLIAYFNSTISSLTCPYHACLYLFSSKQRQIRKRFLKIPENSLRMMPDSDGVFQQPLLLHVSAIAAKRGLTQTMR